jgi:hypothetical protein
MAAFTEKKMKKIKKKNKKKFPQRFFLSTPTRNVMPMVISVTAAIPLTGSLMVSLMESMSPPLL